MSAKAVVLKFGDGRLADGAELRGQLAADIFQRQSFYDLAGAFAKAAGASSDIEPVLHNLLAMKSSLLRDISAALFVFNHKPADVREISVAPSIAKVLAKFAPTAPIIEVSGMDSELISRKTVLTTVAKAIAHRFYRLGRKPYVPGKAIVRAWVDVSLKMYAEEVLTAQVRVFPFPLNRRRQKEFLRELTRREIDWTYDGLSYRMSALLGLLAAGSVYRPVAVAKFEHEAFAGFASEVVREKAGSIYTSDEFEVGAVAAGNTFRVAGKEYINSAHGVGFYCPRTAYSQFRFLTKSQADFYHQSAPHTQFSRRETANFSVTTAISGDGDGASIVFVHQDFRSAGLQAEAHVEAQIISRLDALKLPANVSKFVKIHPNADPKLVGANLNDCKVATNWSDFGKTRSLFLTINSTAFYDLISAGDIAVFKDFSFTPGIYLEGEYQEFNLKNFPKIIKEWLSDNRQVR